MGAVLLSRKNSINEECRLYEFFAVDGWVWERMVWVRKGGEEFRVMAG